MDHTSQDRDTGMPRTVQILGAGLLGTSVGLALSSLGIDVYLADISEDAVRIACGMGAGRPLAQDSPDPELIVVAVPPSRCARVILEALRSHERATVTDVSSVMRQPLDQLRLAGADMRRVVLGHPMAGRETTGPSGAKEHLFVDRLWILSPEPDTERWRVAQVTAVANACKSFVLEMTADEHDAAVALTSHTPQIISSLLALRLTQATDNQINVSGQGLRDITRLAASNPDLWADILASNAGPIIDVLEAFQDDLSGVIRELRAESLRPSDAQGKDGLRHMLRRGREGRSRVPDKHGGEATDYAQVAVVVDDEPGELARVLTAAGEAGVNLEDVHIEHSLGRQRAFVQVDVQPDKVQLLKDVLIQGGWTVRD